MFISIQFPILWPQRSELFAWNNIQLSCIFLQQWYCVQIKLSKTAQEGQEATSTSENRSVIKHWKEKKTWSQFSPCPNGPMRSLLLLKPPGCRQKLCAKQHTTSSQIVKSMELTGERQNQNQNQRTTEPKQNVERSISRHLGHKTPDSLSYHHHLYQNHLY